jgi:hypothetical protein
MDTVSIATSINPFYPQIAYLSVSGLSILDTQYPIVRAKHYIDNKILANGKVRPSSPSSLPASLLPQETSSKQEEEKNTKQKRSERVSTPYLSPSIHKTPQKVR